MISKSQVAELRKDWEENGLADNPEVVDDLLDTIDALWKVAEAAKVLSSRWNLRGLGVGDEHIVEDLCQALAALEDKQ